MVASKALYRSLELKAVPRFLYKIGIEELFGENEALYSILASQARNVGELLTNLLRIDAAEVDPVVLGAFFIKYSPGLLLF